MNEEIEINKQNLKQTQDSEDLRELTLAIDNYKNEMMDIQENITDQMAERDQCYFEFDDEIP
jgi:hypothetical protein